MTVDWLTATDWTLVAMSLTVSAWILISDAHRQEVDDPQHRKPGSL